MKSSPPVINTELTATEHERLVVEAGRPALHWDLERMKRAVESAQDRHYVLPPLAGLTHEQKADCIVEAPFTVKRPWDKAPEWAEFSVQNADGALYWSETEPFRSLTVEGGWATGLAGYRRFCTKGPANPNWSLAIERRPAARTIADGGCGCGQVGCVSKCVAGGPSAAPAVEELRHE